MDDVYAELDEGLFEQATSGFEPEVESNDDDGGGICAMLPDDSPDEEMCEEEEVDASKDVDAQDNEVLSDKISKKQRFMSTGAVCDDNSFQKVPEQPPETFKWKNRTGKEIM